MPHAGKHRDLPLRRSIPRRHHTDTPIHLPSNAVAFPVESELVVKSHPAVVVDGAYSAIDVKIKRHLIEQIGIVMPGRF